MKLKHILMLAAASAALPAPAQQTRVLSADKANEYGIVYSLPVTGVQVEVSTRTVHAVPGPYRQYAPRLLGNADALSAETYRAEVTEVKTVPVAQPGPDKYVMQLKAGATATVTVSSTGMLLGINSGELKDAAAPVSDLKAENAPEPDINEYLQYVDSEYLSSLSSAKRAEMLARTIMEIRESRLALTRGTAETMPADGRQMELMLQSLERQEQALTRAFTGYTYTAAQTRTFLLTPDSTWLASDGARRTVCRVSPSGGVTDADDLSGEPLYLDFALTQRPELPLDAKGEPKPWPKDGVAYTLPSTASLSFSWRGSTVLQTQMELGQLGERFALDPRIFTDKRAPYTALFSPLTGALVSLEAAPQ